MNSGFEPIEAENSCVVNAIAYLQGRDTGPKDWMTDIDNLHNEGIPLNNTFHLKDTLSFR